jgi:glycerophosphoryl diester phosphodiesterase
VRFLRGLAWVLGVLGALYLYFATLHPHQHLPDHPFFDAPEPWAIAHQGGRGLWPENTLYAFSQAEALGVDVLEMDLRATADGEVVVMHDATVDRTTDGTGRVDDMTLAEIHELDAGYRFEDEHGEHPQRGLGLTVPTLGEVLAAFPGSRMILEMKEFTPEQAMAFCRILEEHSARPHVLVASFGHDSMTAFRDACPGVATSATMREGLLLYQLNRMHLSSLYRSPAVALQIPESLGERRVVEPTLLDLASEFNVKVQVWTVNEEADMKRLIDMGVHGIMTDYPDRLLRVLDRPFLATR